MASCLLTTRKEQGESAATQVRKEDTRQGKGNWHEEGKMLLLAHAIN